MNIEKTMHRILQVGLTPKDNLDQWLKQQTTHSITIIEPHPHQSQLLKKQYSEQSKLQVVPAALSTEPEVQTLIDYSLPGFSSISAMSGLKRIFPGLQAQHYFEVNTLSPAKFLEHYGPTENQTATLVFQAKGYETELIQALMNSPRLLNFTEVLLYSATVPLYEDSMGTSTLQKQLFEAGYELVHEQSLSSEWTESYFKRNAVQDEILLLKQQLKNKNQKIQEQQKQLQQLESALITSENEYKKIVTQKEQLTSELKDIKQVEQKNATARKQLQAETQTLQLALVAQKTATEKYAQQAQKTQLNLDRLNKELISLQKQLATQENEQQHQQQLLESALADSSSEHQKAVLLTEKQAQKIKSLQFELEKAEQASSFALEESQKELQIKNKLIAQQQEELTSVKQSQTEISEKLKTTEAKLKEREQWLTNRRKQVEELERELQQKQDEVQQLQAEKGVLARLESRIEQLFNHQSNQIQQATNTLGKHVTKSFVDQRRHTQALVSLQQYLESGEQPLNFDDWSMSAETLNYLVCQIEQNNYDVIIEFGSGASTVIMAKAIAQRLTSQRYSQITKNTNYNKLSYEDIESHSLTHASESQASALLNKAEYDLPRQILSFEQDRNYLKQTQQALISHGVSQVVELVLAPLVPTRRGNLSTEKSLLFYDAEKQLERLARLFEQRTARILIVVDGPSSPKNDPLVREPALATVLQYLSAQYIDILLDDTNRSGEQQVLKHWHELCEERGLAFQARSLDFVTNATWITVRPE